MQPNCVASGASVAAALLVLRVYSSGSSELDVGHLPNLLVIGAMKAATTSLHYYLNAHPDVFMAADKELNFFTSQANPARSEEWYRGHFPSAELVRGESSPSYTFHPFARDVPKRAAAMVPNARLVYVVRDPIERIASHYVHRVTAGREERPFSEVVGSLDAELADDQVEVEHLHEVAGYLCRSMYFRQLSQWLGYFPDDQVRVVSQEDLGRDRLGTLAEIFEFLQVDPCFRSELFGERRNSSTGKRRVGSIGAAVRATPATNVVRRLPSRIREPLVRSFIRAFDAPAASPQISTSDRAGLEALLRDDVARLRLHTGRRFLDWSL